MPEPRDPPPTEEGWYVLHDFRTVDWDAWRDARGRDRQRALDEAIDHLTDAMAVSDSEAGGSALYSVLGHKADFMLLHMRPSSADIGALERRFETTDFAGFTDRTTSFVSVTEASGYSERARGYFEGELDEDSGLARYIRSRLEPTIPDATHVCFYPMDKRRQPEQNWYDLPFEERAEHMDAHGHIGRDYGGKVQQMITGAIALDDWEWGVTLWGDDLTDMKDLLYEMRFDPSTSQYADFGSFYVGRRFPPSDLPALLAGQRVPTEFDATAETAVAETAATPEDAADTAHPNGGAVAADGTDDAAAEGATADHDAEHEHHEADHDHEEEAAAATATQDPGAAETAADTGGEAAETDGSADHDESGAGDEVDAEDAAGAGPPTGGGDAEAEVVEDLATRLATLGVHEGEHYSGGDYGLLLYSGADAKDLADEVDGLRGNFEHYDSHRVTSVKASDGRSAVVSVWDSERAADTAQGFLTDLPGVTEVLRGSLGTATGTGDGATDADDPDHAADTGTGADAEAETETGGDHATASGAEPDPETGEEDADSIRRDLAELDIYAGQPHGEDIYALVLYSRADRETLTSEVEELAAGFDRYDTHEGTSVYEDPHSPISAVVSLWETQDAADTAGDYLTDLPDVVGWAGEGDGFGTMGMFYTVKPEHREEFVEKFETVGEVLEGMDGHRQTALLVDTEDENDMFIASQWDSKADAMSFFRSDAFTDTVDWGRDILADRPRHVFLA